jgi:hypothetical protein
LQAVLARVRSATVAAEGIGDRYARRVALIAGLTIFGGGAASR